MAQNTYEYQNLRAEAFDFSEQRFKSKTDLENAGQKVASETDIEADYLHDFCADLLSDFRNRDYSSLTEEQRKVLANFPGDLEKLLKIIEQLQKQEEEDKEEELQDNLDSTQDKNSKSKRSAKREQRKAERQAKLKEVSGELFIASCASTKPIEESLKFHKKCNLGVEELNKFNKNGVNPIVAILASGKDVKELDKFLKTAGVDVNHKDKDGNTALHNAAAMGLDKKFLEVLVENGANLNAKNNFGLTALDVAAIKGDEKSAEFLLEKGGKSGIAEKNPDLGEEKEGEAKTQKNQKMQEMLKKIKEASKKEEGKENESQERQLKKEPKKDSNELANKEKERLRQEKIRQEKLKQEEIRARMNAEVELAFKMHQERMANLAKENAAKKSSLQKEQQEKYDRELAEKQRIELDRYNLEKADSERRIAEVYAQEQFLREKQILREGQNQLQVEESQPKVVVEEKFQLENLAKKEEQEVVRTANLEPIIKFLQEDKELSDQSYKVLLLDNFRMADSILREEAVVSQDLFQTQQEIKTIVNEVRVEEVKPANPIEEILGVKLSEVTPDTINKMLFEAVRKNQSLLSNLLILCGADVNYRESGVSVLEVAEASGNKSLANNIKTKIFETGTTLQKDTVSEAGNLEPVILEERIKFGKENKKKLSNSSDFEINFVRVAENFVEKHISSEVVLEKMKYKDDVEEKQTEKRVVKSFSDEQKSLQPVETETFDVKEKRLDVKKDDVLRSDFIAEKLDLGKEDPKYYVEGKQTEKRVVKSFSEYKFNESKQEDLPKTTVLNKIIKPDLSRDNSKIQINNKEQNMSIEARPNPVLGFIRRSVETLKPFIEIKSVQQDVQEKPSTAVSLFKIGAMRVVDALKTPHNEVHEEDLNIGSSVTSLSVRISGSVLHDPKNPIKENISDLEVAASKGDLVSSVKLGIVYLSNPANKEEEEVGLKLLKNDKLKDDVVVQKALGEFYYNKSSRDLVVENLQESMKHFENAASKGDQSAIHNLGAIHYACYTKGLTIHGSRESHYEKAKSFFSGLEDKKLSEKELGRLKSAKEFIDEPKKSPATSVTR